MDYQSFSELGIAEQDKAFAHEFENFVNGRMQSARLTGQEMAKAHRYLQQEMFKVCTAYMRQLAINYQKGYYDQRNEWAAQLSAIAYDHLTESEQFYDPDYKKAKQTASQF